FGYDGDGQGELAHPARRFSAGSLGGHSARGDMGRLLGPGLGVAVRIAAAPAPLQPDESGRMSEAGQFPDVDPLRSWAAPRTPQRGHPTTSCRRLDAD